MFLLATLLWATLTLFSSPTPAMAQDADITVAITAGEGIDVVNGENRVDGDSFNVTITFSEDIGTTFTHSDITSTNAETIITADLTTDTAGLVFTVTVRPTDGFSGDLTLQVAAGVANDASNKANEASNTFTATITMKSACITGGAVAASAPELASDCAVLLDLHDDLVGTATLSPAWSVSTSIDAWQGITVQDSRIYEIGLSGAMLDGTIPENLGGLDYLRRLDLSHNDLTGSIPEELGSLSQMVQLALNENELAGSIPSQLGNLANLEGLFLFGNKLSGSIPIQLGSLGQLDQLALGNNALTGSIPIQLGSLSQLTDLSLRRNQLTGSIPIQLGSLSQLTNLSLGNNQLTGTIPAELGSLSQLQHLILNENQLTGSIPTGLGSLSQLQTLSLESNEISGSIPSQLGSLGNLELLYLHRNMLTGTIPAMLGGLGKLRFLHAFGNELTGSIPMELGMLSKLEDLSLFDNQLSGNIPGQLGNLESLQQLMLQDNQLEGAIPSDLNGLNSLTTLNLQKNRLTGAIPDLSGMPQLRVLWLNENDLTGAVPLLTNLPQLEQLYAHSNQLSGQIPDMSGLPKLRQLILACNQLSGPIPDSLGTVSSLQFLILLDNDLSGEIPDLTQLTSLQRLLINHNFLEGDFSSTDALINLLPQVSQLIVTLNGNVFVGVDPLTGQVSDLPSWVVATKLASCTPRISFISQTYNGAEGDMVDVVVALGVEQEEMITIPIVATNQDGASDSDYSVPESVTFDSGETEMTITFSIAQDMEDDDDESVVLGFGTGLPGGTRSVSIVETTVFITDDDNPEVEVSFGQSAYNVAEGATQTVTVTLSADPERTVVIPLTATNQGGASGADHSVPMMVTFDAGDVTKDITFTATEDDIDDDGESVVLGLGANLPDRVSESATNPSATVTILDDDTRGVMVSPTPLPVDEGMTATYTVVLESEPTGSVTVTVNDPTDNTDVTADPLSLTFDENNWDTPKTVTVSAIQDADGVDDDATVTHTVSGADYASETASDVRVTVDDDETPGVTIDPKGITVLPGGSNEYTVVLGTEPTVPVTVTVSGQAGTDLTVNPEQITFDMNDWDTPKTVEVSAGGTAETDTITLSHHLSGGEYGPLSADDVAVTIVKASGALNLQVGITASPQSLTVPEDQSRTYSVFLSAVPTGNVTVTITLPTGNDLSIDMTVLTFTTNNWNVPQNVRVTADDDDDGIPDASVTIGNAVSGGGYDSGDNVDIEVTIEENDTPAVSLTTRSLVIAEGETDTYKVALDTKPSDDVTVVINDPADNTDVMTGPAFLTFTPSNWSTPQTVTVTTVADLDTFTDTATITHSVSGGDYEMVDAKNVLVTVTDGCHVIWCGVLVMEKDSRYLEFVSLDDDDFDYKGQYYLVDSPLLYGGREPGIETALTVNIPERAWFRIDVRGPLFETEHYLDWTLYVNDVELPFSQAKTVWAKLPSNWRIRFYWYGNEFHGLFPPGEQGAGTTLYLSIAETPLDDQTPKPPGPPLHLSVDTWNRDELRALWIRPQRRDDNDHKLHIDSYTVQWKSGSGSWETPADVTEAVFTPSAARFFYSYAIGGLTPGEEYDVRVIATDKVRDSEPSNVATGMTEPESSTQQSAALKSNSPATGGPGIQGTARVGETLTATTSQIEDEDGLDNAVFAYQWVRAELGAQSGTDIAGATGASYVVTADDVGKAITVRVTFTDDAGNEESAPSSISLVAAPAWPPTPQVPDAPGAPEVSVHESGSLAVSWTAPASDGGSAVTGYKVQWKEAVDDWDAPADVTEAAVTGTNHTITGLTDGAEYSVRVLAINDNGESIPSADGNGTPRETVPPELSEASVDGATLTLAFSEDLTETPLPAVTTFTVTVGQDARGVDSLEITGSSVTLTLASAVTSSDQVTVSYTVPTDAAAARLKDLSDNPAESFADQAVTNNTAAAQRRSRQQQENSPATGSPTISGTAQVGETLTASTTDISDTDRLTKVSYAYQWTANDGTSDSDIADATASTYTVTVGDVGKTIKVKVSFTDDAGNEESLTSSETAEVAATWKATLTVGSGENSGTAFKGYSVFADGLGGLTPREFLIGEEQYSVNLLLYSETTLSLGLSGNIGTGFVLHLGTNTFDLGDSSTRQGDTAYIYSWSDVDLDWSEADTVVVALVEAETEEASGNSPATGTPSISGTVEVGKTLTASTSGISDDDGLTNVSYSYQWVRNNGSSDTDIQDATGASYSLVDADEGKTIKVEVSFTDDAGNDETLTSAATTAVAARPNSPATGAPTISGTAQVEETLTSSTSGIADIDGLTNVSYSYQWIRNDGATDTDIQDATGASYSLVDADEGKTIKVEVSFTDDAGNDETLTSAATSEVVAAPSPLTVILESSPASYNGTDPFTFQIRFSEEFRVSFKTLRDHTFTVDGGVVTKAARQVKGSNLGWTITVEPDSNAAVRIILPATTDCDATGAICTQDGRKLSNSLDFTVSGPS